MDPEFQPNPQPNPLTDSAAQARPAMVAPDLQANMQQPVDQYSAQVSSQVSGLGSRSIETEPMLPNGNPITVSNQFWKVDPRSIQVDRISSLIFCSILLVAALVALGVFWFAGLGEFNTVWIAIASSVALLLLLLFGSAIFWPWLTYHKASWRLDEEGLEIRRGVLWRHRITVPLGRVQHADVSQGPLQRQFGISTLTVHTAGTQHASIPLPGLTFETAIELRDLMVGQKKDQHVV